MPTIQEILGPLLGFLFTIATMLFIGLTARWMREREQLPLPDGTYPQDAVPETVSGTPEPQPPAEANPPPHEPPTGTP